MSSKIKDLRNDPRCSFNLIDLLTAFVPKDKTKYVELLYKLTNELTDEVDHDDLVELCHEYDIDVKMFDGMPTIHFYFFRSFLEYVYNRQDIINFKKFCEFNEKGLIKQNDISKYKSFEEINVEFHEAEEREKIKELDSQIIKIFEDNEWIVLKPLSYQSSLKYGADTKWCTASKDLSSHFDSYTKKGILIYVISRKTKLKVASFKSLSDNELTYWNQIDKRVDSSETGLPYSIIELIRDEMKSNPSTNQSLMNKINPKEVHLPPLLGRKPRSERHSMDEMFNTLLNDPISENRINRAYKSITGSSIF